MWTADLYWPLESFRIEDVVELAGGRLAFIGVSEDTPGDSFATVQVFSAAGSPQWDIQLRADRPVDLGTLVQHPATCAAPATHGQSCLVEDMTCANAAAQTCTCDGGAWSCSAAPPELHLIWSTPGSAHAWRQSALSWSGSPLTHHHADAALGRAVGRARVTPAGGVELPLATTTGNFEWMWTDSTLDWGCGRSPSTDVLSADFATSWAVSTINAGPASVGAWRTTSNPFLPIATALPAPIASVVCADTVCP
jgi:hypothetical protein